MQTVSVILAVLDILICVALIILIIAQEGQDRGMGALTGGSSMDTFYSKNSGQSKEKNQRKMTLILSVAFIVVTIALYAIISL